MSLLFFIYTDIHMKKTHIIALIALLCLAGGLIYLWHENAVKSQEIAKYEQNYKAAMDSIHFYELKNGEHAAAQQAWLLNEKEMLAKLGMAKEELNDIKKRIGTPTTITQVVTETKIDTTYMPGEVIYAASDSMSAAFSFKDDWLQMSGRTDITPSKSNTVLYNLEMNTPLTVGMTKDDKFFVTTPNPYVKFTSITSIQNEKYKPKKKHWGVGVNAGWGVYYDMKSKTLKTGPGATVGVNYNF